MNEEIEKLAELAGFSNYEKGVYKALYDKGKATVKELAKESTVPKPKVYTVLDRLHNDGFVALEAENPKTYSVINPSSAFKDLLEQRKNSIQELEDFLENTGDRPGAEKNFLKIMRGKETVLNFLAEQLEAAEEEYVTLARFVSSSTPLQPIMEERSDEIEMKFLGPEKHSKEYVVKKYRKLGIDVRLGDMETIPFRFSVYDNDKLALTISGEEEGYITIWTNNPSFVENMSQFFRYQWNNAE